MSPIPSGLFTTTGKAIEDHVAAVTMVVAQAMTWMPALERAVEALKRLRAEHPHHRVFVAGNGGSAANAAHCAAHLVDCGFDARCLTDNTPLFTARANDGEYNYALGDALPTWVKAGGREDAVVLFSCSGTSVNITNLERIFGERGCLVITFYGFSRQRTWEYALNNYTQHYPIDLDSENVAAIEDCHSVMLHAMREALRP